MLTQAAYRFGISGGVILALTVITAGEPAAPTKLADADLFFTAYRNAVHPFDPRTLEAATVPLDAWAKKLTTSPWLEMVLLKGTELWEPDNLTAAQEGYEALRLRLSNPTYFPGDIERARLFRVAPGGAAASGILRVRPERELAGLQRYFNQYPESPESLAPLAALRYGEQQDIVGKDAQPLRYVPAAVVMRPFISYKRLEGLKISPLEPLVVNHPRVETITQLGNDPPQWTTMLVLSAPGEVARARVDPTLQSYLVATTAHDGVTVCNLQCALVLLTPDGK